MGAYLSEPSTEKHSSDETGDRLSYGASSMQGWRTSQEDAHFSIIKFDKDTSLFAVFDGHGGHEVAQYTAEKLPDFLKNLEPYKNGDMKQALIDAFVKFDETLTQPEVIETLKEMADRDNKGEGDTECVGDEDVEENRNELLEEAHMPLDEVIKKYIRLGAVAPSPYIKSKRPGTSSAGEGSSSSCQEAAAGSSSSSSTAAGAATSSSSSAQVENDETVPSSAGSSTKQRSVETENTEKTNGNEATTIKDSNSANKEEKLVNGEAVDATETSEDQKSVTVNGSSDEAAKVNGDVNKTVGNANGDVTTATEDTKCSESVKPGATKDSCDKTPKVKRLGLRNTKINFIKALADTSSSDSEDENDQSFMESVESSDDDDEDDEMDEDEEEDIEETDEECDEECDDEDNEFLQKMTEEPGSDSGCTAVVALLKGNDLYVANAGDSRCVLSKGGKAHEMSFDHKPENEEEMTRIMKAGGRVTSDGRVNGGLNLSRAIGDHAYKLNKELSATEQMIVALPDVVHATVDPEHDDFMVLACDGIWNFMTSDEVIDFVGTRLKQGRDKLSQICEEMFDHCLAPNTVGDGTGCDNMTAIIVDFRTNRSGGASSQQSAETQKRSASEEPEVGEPESKRVKLDGQEQTTA